MRDFVAFAMVLMVFADDAQVGGYLKIVGGSLGEYKRKISSVLVPEIRMRKKVLTHKESHLIIFKWE